MVAILLPQPDEPARGPGPARVVPSRRRATNPYPRPVDLATVEAIPLRSVPRALPDRPADPAAPRSPFSWPSPCSPPPPRPGVPYSAQPPRSSPSSPQPVDAPASSPPGETYVVSPETPCGPSQRRSLPTLIPGRWWTRSATPAAADPSSRWGSASSSGWTETGSVEAGEATGDPPAWAHADRRR